jgi:DedD protein
MADPTYREIQLSGKQLVFLFMASVVLAVSVFLLGVSVGRGVRGTAASTDAESAEPAAVASTDTPVEMPPATQTSEADLSYHDQLQGQTSPPAQPMPPPVPREVTPSPAARPAAQPPPTSTAPPAPAPVAAAPSRPAPASSSSWVVQVAAFGSNENANRLAAQLKGKGYSAFVESAGPRNALLRVAVGPFADRAEADRTAARLQREEGFKPLVTH